MLSANNILSPSNGAPMAVPTQDMVLGIYYLTKERPARRASGARRGPALRRLRGSADRLRQRGRRPAGAHPRCAGTARSSRPRWAAPCFNEIVPEPLRFVNQELKKKEITDARRPLLQPARQRGAPSHFLDELKDLGFRYATLSGLSIGIDDMHIPSAKERAHRRGARAGQRGRAAVPGRRHHQRRALQQGGRHLGARHRADRRRRCSSELEGGEQGGEFNPIYMMADSGARGSKQQIRQLAGMRGLMAKPSGEIIETPITSNFREGLTVLEYFTSTHGARKGLADTALKTADSGYLTRRLVDVSQDVIVSRVRLRHREVHRRHAARRGRRHHPVAARPHPRPRGRGGRPRPAHRARSSCRPTPRSPRSWRRRSRTRASSGCASAPALTCDTKRGICVMCYGRNLGTGRLAELGRGGRHHRRAVHRRAGHPAHDADVPHRRHREPGRGGLQARGQERRRREVPQPPHGREPRRRPRGHQPQRRDRAWSTSGAGSASAIRSCTAPSIKVKAEPKVKAAHGAGRVGPVHQPDPHRVHGQGAVPGHRRGRDRARGVRRGHRPRAAGHHRGPTAGCSRASSSTERSRGRRPRDGSASGTATRCRWAPTCCVADGADVFAADIIAKIPRETTKTKDITGGLPRVAELFEARKPKEQAVITEIDGAVEIGGFVKGMRKIVIRADNGETKEYLIPRGKHISVHEGDRVKAGEALMDGSPEPARLPRRPRRPRAAAVPRERGAGGLPPAGRDDQRQAHRDHRAPDAAARAHRGGRRHRLRGRRARRQVRVPGGERPGAGARASARPPPSRCSSASPRPRCRTDSFISAASFQETTRVLTEAAICGKTDDLRGLKENVIVGRLIPAGTGLSNYTRVEVLTPGRRGSQAAGQRAELRAAPPSSPRRRTVADDRWRAGRVEARSRPGPTVDKHRALRL